MSTFEHTAILTHLHSAQQIFSFFLEGDLAHVVPEQGARGGGGQLRLHHLLQLQQQVDNGNVQYSQSLERDNTLKRVTVSNYPLELHSQSKANKHGVCWMS